MLCERMVKRKGVYLHVIACVHLYLLNETLIASGIHFPHFMLDLVCGSSAAQLWNIARAHAR